MEFSNYTKEELLNIYREACETYEAGEEPIMSDEEYDELVNYLGIENDATIGSTEHSKSKAYTVKHSFIMGSLDKVHMEKSEDGQLNIDEVLEVVNRHLSKAHPKMVQATPKYDGCSFSLESYVDSATGKHVVTVATRGDGAFGKDITQHFINNKFYAETFDDLESYTREKIKNTQFDRLVIRGEAIVNRFVYQEKYSSLFKNPRVFVSGRLNHEYTPDDTEFVAMCDDIDYVCYDYRLVDSKTKEYVELDWTDDPAIPGFNMLNNVITIDVTDSNNPLSYKDLSEMYAFFEKYRKEQSPFQLDGIVLKPDCESRLYNIERERPEDMIAIKFVAEDMSSTIVDVEWSVGLTGECFPTAIVEPVYQDGKTITRASLHGYSYMMVNKVGIGSKITMVMNGDIVPGVKSVLTTGTMKMPDFDTNVEYRGENNTPHLMKIFSVQEMRNHSFVSSAKALAIDGIAEKTADRIWNSINNSGIMGEECELSNIMELMNENGYRILQESLGTSKSTLNIINSLMEYKQHMTLADVVRGMCIRGCGVTASEQVARYLSGLSYDMGSMSSESYKWAFEDTPELEAVKTAQKLLGIPDMTDSQTLNENMSDGSQIPIIMTGDPSKCTGYATKKQWLAAHPQYKETTKWAECKILFTNDMESKTGKMAKAAKNNVEVRLYED